MTDEGTARGGLRDRTRRTMRAELAALAVRLFTEKGYDATTVDDIAREAGVSKRSFFRYFATKEDAVFSAVETLSERVADDIRACPAGDGPWECLRRVLGRWEREIDASQRRLSDLRLIEATPALRAAFARKREEWRDQAAQALRARPGTELDPFTADLLTAAAASALDAASREWLRSGGTADRGALLDRAFSVLRPGV
ncbi:TetR family transcriptional regulator [Allonocardiopsis opalescens]|uniref:TetR family transcriptional regulator n=1 Tax=Allonocardiopsis opalescens TaxID=1144618 RepID=A0A2T0QCA2_9ACTN|nr:TetR family transcriptional regulator [Allonocardiopsis opalescens]PRY01547.1 TetR family transcriptional regulator [Allonocardiopsis opalescens]